VTLVIMIPDSNFSVNITEVAVTTPGARNVALRMRVTSLCPPRLRLRHSD